MGVGIVAAARGNPFAKKTYIKTEVDVAGAEVLGFGAAAITDTDTTPRQQSWFDSMSMEDLAWWDPASKEVNIEMVIYEESGGSLSQVDSYRDSVDLKVTNSYRHTFTADLGPLQEDATGYQIELILTAEDGSTEDTKTLTGSL
ncbi:MAG: hypothetical protein ACOC53_08355 [Candidatus Saliniplasma sp.]